MNGGEILPNQTIKRVKSLQKLYIWNSRGAVLLEFALSIPVLLLLLFGLHDVFVISHMQDKSRLVSHEIASMLQNISQNREDKKITENDIKRITCAAYLTIYPGTTMYSTNSGKRYHKYAHYPQPFIFCAKSDSTGKAYTPWMIGFSPEYNTNNPIKCARYYVNYDLKRLAVHYRAAASGTLPSSIYKDLKMKPNEMKILVDGNIYMCTDSNEYGTKYSDGRKPTLKGVCGLHLLNPPYMKASTSYHLFHSVAIFSPRKGLFDKTAPKR